MAVRHARLLHFGYLITGATLASRARRFQLAAGAPGAHANVPRASARRNLRTAALAVVVATSAT
jgi:hypothetical protein